MYIIGSMLGSVPTLRKKTSSFFKREHKVKNNTSTSIPDLKGMSRKDSLSDWDDSSPDIRMRKAKMHHRLKNNYSTKKDKSSMRQMLQKATQLFKRERKAKNISNSIPSMSGKDSPSYWNDSSPEIRIRRAKTNRLKARRLNSHIHAPHLDESSRRKNMFKFV